MMDRATADNKRQKDAPHLYISSSLHPDCRCTMDAAQLFVCGNREDSFAVDFMRNRLHAVGKS